MTEDEIAVGPLTEDEIAVLRRVRDGSGRASTDSYVCERLYADGLIGSAGVTAAGRIVLSLLDQLDAQVRAHENDLEHLGRMTRICAEQRAQLAKVEAERDKVNAVVDMIRHSPVGGLLEAMSDPRCKTYAAHLAVTDAGEQWEMQARRIVGPSAVSKLAEDRDTIERLTRQVAKLEHNLDMACNALAAGGECSGCGLARERAAKGEL